MTCGMHLSMEAGLFLETVACGSLQLPALFLVCDIPVIYLHPTMLNDEQPVAILQYITVD